MSEYQRIRNIAMGAYHTILNRDEKVDDYEFVMARSDVDELNREAGRVFTHICGMKIAVDTEPGEINYARKKADAQRISGTDSTEADS